MATIPTAALDKLRRCVARKLQVDGEAIDYLKAEANAVFQAIEDWEVAGHSSTPTESREAAMEAAMGRPLTQTQEIAFWGCWAQWKMQDLGV